MFRLLEASNPRWRKDKMKLVCHNSVLSKIGELKTHSPDWRVNQQCFVAFCCVLFHSFSQLIGIFTETPYPIRSVFVVVETAGHFVEDVEFEDFGTTMHAVANHAAFNGIKLLLTDFIRKASAHRH